MYFLKYKQLKEMEHSIPCAFSNYICDSESIRFGKISFLSNESDDPETIYNLYNQREVIEHASDAMKNELEMAYMSDNNAPKGILYIFSLIESVLQHICADHSCRYYQQTFSEGCPTEVLENIQNS